jgi:metal transporter CNNM
MTLATYPISKPLQLLLDNLFPARAAGLHSRHELGLLISEHTDHEESELDESEVEIIQGALMLSEKRVSHVMTPLEDVYWLKLSDSINDRRIDDIKLHNWSRIPVFNKELTECYGLLLMKDLVDIDFDDRSYKVSELPLRRTQPVGDKTALDTIFRRFIAARTHLMPVTHGDKIVGVVSIEDVFEEIIGQEIEDETDGIALKRHGEH